MEEQNLNNPTPATPINLEQIKPIRPKRPIGIILSGFAGIVLLITLFVTVNGALHQQQAASHASFSGIITGNIYRFINKCSGEALEVSNNSTKDSAPIVQWPWTDNGYNNDRRWMITQQSDGSYIIQPMNSLMYLAVANNSASQGAQIIQQGNFTSSSTNAEWLVASLGNNIYRIINKNSGMAIGIQSCTQGRGAPISQWKDDGSQRLQWIVEQQTHGGTPSASVSPTCTPRPQILCNNAHCPVLSPPPGGWCSPQPSLPPSRPPIQQTKYWLLYQNAASALLSTTAGAPFIHAINTAKTYEIVPRGQTPAIDPLPNATHVESFASYQDMQNAFANNQIPTNIKVILYDNQNASGTPQNEQQQPFTYVPQAEQLVHQHGLLFMNAPAADLSKVLEPSAPDKYSGYLQAQLANLAQYSDIFIIQAENAPTSGEYYSFVQQALFIARSANSKAIILLGIIARSNGPTSQTITDEVNRTFSATDGYRFDIGSDSNGSYSITLPIALPVIQSLTSY